MTDATTTPNNAAPTEQNPSSQKNDQKNASTSQPNQGKPTNAGNEKSDNSRQDATTENQNTKSAN